jgi:hypothetical protein
MQSGLFVLAADMMVNMYAIYYLDSRDGQYFNERSNLENTSS